MTRHRIIVTRKLPGAVEARLRDHFTVAFNRDDRPFSQSRLQRALEESDGMLCTVSDLFDETTIKGEGRRRASILANFGVGVNNIDLDAAEAAGLTVTNTPGVLTEATADLAMALILSVTRRMTETEAALRAGAWRGFAPTGWLGTGLQGKTLGIIGMGRIGQATARRAQAGFGMRIAYCSRSPKGPFNFPATALGSIEEVVESADVISLHLPGGAANAGLFSTEMIARMKPTAYLVNTARGDLIDEPVLAAALRARRIAGAGLDVFADEPHVPDSLRALENVTLLPHIGSATVETRTAMGMLAIDNLIAHFAGAPLPARVV